MNSFIFIAQVIALTTYSSTYMFFAYLDSLQTRYPLRVVVTIYDVWNLNVFPRFYVPPFCMTNHFTMFQGMALEYITAFYPLILIVLLYVSIKLHNWNFRPLVYCWKPFLKCFLRFRRSIDRNTSVIDVFVTFIVLSYWKLLVVVWIFLCSQPLYNGRGEKLSTSVMAFSTSILCSSTKNISHWLYFLFLYH